MVHQAASCLYSPLISPTRLTYSPALPRNAKNECTHGIHRKFQMAPEHNLPACQPQKPSTIAHVPFRQNATKFTWKCFAFPASSPNGNRFHTVSVPMSYYHPLCDHIAHSCITVHSINSDGKPLIDWQELSCMYILSNEANCFFDETINYTKPCLV